MKLIYKFLPKYVFYSLPAVIACAVWGTINQENKAYTGLLYFLWELLSLNILIWFFSLFLIIVLLTFSKIFREMLLPRWTFLTERDERESQLSGTAARNTYLATIALTFLMLFLTSFQFGVRNLPMEEQVDGKTKALSIALKMNLLEEKNKTDTLNSLGFSEIPLTKQAILLIILTWHIGSFAFARRRVFDDSIKSLSI